MNFIFPRLSRSQFLASLEIAASGALIAGSYGAVHDQISFTISPEYFTRMKFSQFALEESALPPRILAAEVGFLATWWVGLIGGWILARVGLADSPPGSRRRRTLKAFAIVVAIAAVCGAIGTAAGWIATGITLEPWLEIGYALGVDDLRAFVIVAFLHEAGYLGAALGVLVAVLFVRKRLAKDGAIVAPRG